MTELLDLLAFVPVALPASLLVELSAIEEPRKSELVAALKEREASGR